MQNPICAERSAVPSRSINILGLLLLLVGLAASGCSNHGKRLEFGSGTLYYTENVTEDQAKKLGETLQKSSHFANKEWKAQLDKAGALWKLNLVEDAAKVNDPTFKVWITNYNLQLSKQVFSDGKVQIDLCDDDFNPLKTFPPTYYGRRVGFGPSDLYIGNNITPQEAKTIGSHLVKIGYFGKSPETAQLQKGSDGRYAFRIMVKSGTENNPEFLQRTQKFAQELTSVMGNKPVEVHLCNLLFKTIRVVKADSTAATAAPAPGKPAPTAQQAPAKKPNT
ncbi:MAG: hypothetical protein IPM61_12070 [Chlorobi bacterium]|nr:MAG: hypothetical protein UZ07_CHB004001762 [Chlorobi bacterium OLB7]MBK8912049.1 hypothetical protein [Chlorobiota bacterium]